MRKRDRWSEWLPSSTADKPSNSTDTPGGQPVVRTGEFDDNEKSDAVTSGDCNNNYGSGKGSSVSATESLERSTSDRSSSNHPVANKPARFNFRAKKNRDLSARTSRHDVNELSNDFANTFMLDEELELEHKALQNSSFSPTKRYVDQVSCIFTPSLRPQACCNIFLVAWQYELLIVILLYWYGKYTCK